MATFRSCMRNTTVRLAMVVILLVLISATSMLALLYQSTLSSAREALALQQQTNANYLYNQIAFYQEIIDQLARRTQVKDLLNVGHDEEAMAWALDTQTRLPNSIGLALLRPGMELLGNPALQRVTPSCMADLHALKEGAVIARPPVHLDTRELAHFDLIANVAGHDDESIGTLFASFSLEILHNTLESLTRPGQLQRIRDGAGRLLAHAGKLSADAPALEHSQPVPNTDWILETRSILTPDNHPSQQPLVIATLIISVVLILVAGLFAWRTVRHESA